MTLFNSQMVPKLKKSVKREFKKARRTNDWASRPCQGSGVFQNPLPDRIGAPIDTANSTYPQVTNPGSKEWASEACFGSTRTEKPCCPVDLQQIFPE